MLFIQEIDGVQGIRLARSVFGKGLYFTAAYWVDGLVIDSGCSYTVRELVSALADLHVEMILNTHSHEDHIGANLSLHGLWDAAIYAHPHALPILADPRNRQPLKPYQQIMWGYPEASQASAVGEQIETQHHNFQVIHTPGHSPDHICLYESNRGWLFSGDAFVGGRDRALRADFNIWQIIDSLKKLALLDVSFLFAGSGRIRENPIDEIREKIAYLEETGDKVLELHTQGQDYSQIRRTLFGRELPIAYLTLGNFSGKQLVRSFIEDKSSQNLAVLHH
jgi:glyoxylase-like metal-dependent hydrolase (beta-lactamase superfamily II)